MAVVRVHVFQYRLSDEGLVTVTVAQKSHNRMKQSCLERGGNPVFGVLDEIDEKVTDGIYSARPTVEWTVSLIILGRRRLLQR